MKFSLRQLQVFYYVAEYQSVSDAAKALNMSQSAASMALSQLETLLGNPLFKRQGRQMALNQRGQWLRPHVNQLLAGCHTIEQGMKEQDLVSGLIKMGISQTPADYIVPNLVAELDRDFPRLELQLAVENTEHVIEGLLEFRYDLGVIEGHCDDERLTTAPLCEDELVIVASAQHPFANQGQTSLEQLEQSQWILRERGAGTREIFDICIHEHVDRIQVHREFDHVPTIISLVSQGPYLSCLSYRAVADAVKNNQLVIVSVSQLSMKRSFSFIWRKQDSESAIRETIMKTAAHFS